MTPKKIEEKRLRMAEFHPERLFSSHQEARTKNKNIRG